MGERCSCKQCVQHSCRHCGACCHLHHESFIRSTLTHSGRSRRSQDILTVLLLRVQVDRTVCTCCNRRRCDSRSSMCLCSGLSRANRLSRLSRLRRRRTTSGRKSTSLGSRGLPSLIHISCLLVCAGSQSFRISRLWMLRRSSLIYWCNLSSLSGMRRRRRQLNRGSIINSLL